MDHQVGPAPNIEQVFSLADQESKVRITTQNKTHSLFWIGLVIVTALFFALFFTLRKPMECPHGQVPSNGKCVDCVTSFGCGSDVCTKAGIANACKQCTKNEHCLHYTCPGNGACISAPICDQSNGICTVPCATSQDCLDAGLTTNPVCATSGNSSGNCVQCLVNEDCASFAVDGQPSPVCDVTTNSCVLCLDDGDCPGSSSCNPNNHRCQSGCSIGSCTGGQVCVDSLCQDCSFKEGKVGVCKGDTPHCSSNNTCVQCVLASDCPSGKTCRGNACVELVPASTKVSISAQVKGQTHAVTAFDYEDNSSTAIGFTVAGEEGASSSIPHTFSFSKDVSGDWALVLQNTKTNNYFQVGSCCQTGIQLETCSACCDGVPVQGTSLDSKNVFIPLVPIHPAEHFITYNLTAYAESDTAEATPITEASALSGSIVLKTKNCGLYIAGYDDGTNVGIYYSETRSPLVISPLS